METIHVSGHRPYIQGDKGMGAGLVAVIRSALAVTMSGSAVVVYVSSVAATWG
jgi:hypothetical protein